MKIGYARVSTKDQTVALQFERYLTRAFEEAYKIGQKPVAAEIVEGVLVPTSTPSMPA